MKKTPQILAAVMSLVLTAVLLAAEPREKELSSPVGTWRHLSSKESGAKEFSDVSKDQIHIKMITATHFTWVMYDSNTKLVSASMGGSYTLVGDKYTEKVEFYLPEAMKEYSGKDQVFTIKIDGDKLLQSGTLSDGQKIEEVWQRVK